MLSDAKIINPVMRKFYEWEKGWLAADKVIKEESE